MVNGLGQRLQKQRILRNLSQKEVSSSIGISASVISNYESGERTPSVEGITPIGQSALKDWEKEIMGSLAKEEKQDIVIIKNYNFLCGLKINFSLLSGSSSIFSALDFGNRVKEMLQR